MANKSKLSPKYLEILKQIFSDIPNRRVAEILTVRINEDRAQQALMIRKSINDGSVAAGRHKLKELSSLMQHVSVSERTIQNYARLLGLRKSEKFMHQYRKHTYRQKYITRLKKIAISYSGSPMNEIDNFRMFEDRVLRFETQKDIDSLLSAVYRHNKKERSRSGNLISVETFRDILIVIMMDKPPSIYPYKNLPFPEVFRFSRF